MKLVFELPLKSRICEAMGQARQQGKKAEALLLNPEEFATLKSDLDLLETRSSSAVLASARKFAGVYNTTSAGAFMGVPVYVVPQEFQ